MKLHLDVPLAQLMLFLSVALCLGSPNIAGGGTELATDGSSAAVALEKASESLAKMTSESPTTAETEHSEILVKEVVVTSVSYVTHVHYFTQTQTVVVEETVVVMMPQAETNFVTNPQIVFEESDSVAFPYEQYFITVPRLLESATLAGDLTNRAVNNDAPIGGDAGFLGHTPEFFAAIRAKIGASTPSVAEEPAEEEEKADISDVAEKIAELMNVASKKEAILKIFSLAGSQKASESKDNTQEAELSASSIFSSTPTPKETTEENENLLQKKSHRSKGSNQSDEK